MKRFITVLIFSFFPVLVQSQELKQEFESVFQENHFSFPNVGLVVSVSSPGKILWENADGYSDRAFGIRTEADHKFRIGSVTKQFTAVAVLKLAEENRLSLQDKLSKYFPNLNGAGEVTIENLLTHTSGITDYTSKPEWFPKYSKTFTTPEDVYEFIRKDSLSFVSGSRFKYNNSGYHLLGLIIQKVTGKAFSDYLKEVIFSPLKMENTFSLDSQRVVKNMAQGYEIRNGIAYNAEFIHPAQPFSAGNLVSTVEDLRKWYSGLFQGKIIKPETLKKAMTPFKLNDSTLSQYGYGWQLKEFQGMPEIWHNGGYPGYLSEVHYFPESGVLIIALSNAMPLSKLIRDLTAVAHGKPVERLKFLDLSPDDLQPFTAASYTAENETWNFEVIDSELYYSINEGVKYRILPVSKTKFYSPDWDVYVEFMENEGHSYSSFLLHYNGQTYSYSRKEKL